jgi:hypothetical protein
MCVATVGSFVDWKKEVQFVISRAKSDEKNIVSTIDKKVKACSLYLTPFKFKNTFPFAIFANFYAVPRSPQWQSRDDPSQLLACR